MTRITLGKTLALALVPSLLVGAFVYSKFKHDRILAPASAEIKASDTQLAKKELSTPLLNKSIKSKITDADPLAPKPIRAPKQERIDSLDTVVPVITSCDFNCQADIMAKLRAGDSLSPFEIEALRLYADNMTEMMPLTSADISMFEAALIEDDDRRKAAAISLLSTLNIETQTRIGTNLTGAPAASTRLIGYEFLSRAASTNSEAAQNLQSALVLEPNKHILFEVIEAGELDVEAEILAGNKGARSLALDTLYTTHTDPNVRGAALMAQSRSMQNEDRLQGDIREALISDSADLHDYALNSLSIVLKRQSQQGSGQKWNERADIRGLLEGFATSSDSNEDIRESAEKMLSRYFN